MKKLQIIGFLVLVASLIGFLLWRFNESVPDWFARVNGILMLISIFIVVFSSKRLSMKKC